MKKLLTLLLALIMCLTVLTSCDQVLDMFFDFQEPPVEETPDEEVTYEIEKAEAFLKNLYKDVNPVTASDYEVIGNILIKGVNYAVTWTSNNEKIKVVALDNGNYRIDVDEKSEAEEAYTLTATITAGNGETKTVVYERKVPEYLVLSWDEYMAAKADDVVVVEGIVVAMNAKSLGNSRNHLFLADASGKGGYYSYQMDEDPVEAGVKVGMTVSVSGPITPYSGMQEIKGGTFTIVDETIKTVDPIDITDKILAGTIDFSEYVALPVTIKGVTIGTQDLATASSQYLYFEINGVKSYVRTYVTDFPTTLDIVVNEDKTTSSEAKTAIDTLHAEKFGWKADVTGILVLFSGNPYLIPMSVDCFDNFVWEEKTADEKVDAELADLAFDSTVTSDKVIDLLGVGKYYDDVTITWTTDNENAVVADGKLTLTVPNGTIVVKVTAKATCGDVTKERVFEIKLSKEATPVADIIEIGAAMEHNTYTEGKYITAGIITEVYNTQYGNMRITDANGNILTVYGTYGADGVDRYDALESKPVAGDYVVLLGVVGQYNGTPQMKNAWILSFTSPTSIKDALEICTGSEDNKFDGEKHVVTGVIVEVYNTQYGNMRIQDEEGNILTIYGSYDANGKNRYDALETKPVAGDTVTLYGPLGRYGTTCQMKNGWIIGHTPAPTGEEHVCADENGDYICDDEECGKVVAPAADSTLTVEQILALGAVHAHNTYTEGKYYVTGVITEVYNAQYGNMYITDANGNILTIYGTYSADGSARYDAMETKPVAGDTVTIYGIIGQYNGTVQVKNGWITAHTASDAPHVNKLVVGETNKIVVNGETLNAYNLPIEWITFVADEKAVYTFVGDSNALAWIYDLNGNLLCNMTGTATLEAGTYAICVGNGVVGEFNVTVTKAAIEAPEHTCADANGDFLCDSEDCGKILVPVADSTLTVEQVLALGAAHAHNTYTEGKYSVTGVITEVYNTQYGNMKIKDENGNILTIYGTYSADGSTRYDAMETKPVAGDTVTVYGIVGQYNGTAQVKNGWITAHTAPEAPHTCESVCPVEGCGKCTNTECTEEVCANNRCPGHEEVHVCEDANGDFVCDDAECGKILVPAADSTLTIKQALTLGALFAKDKYTEGKYYVTGTIKNVYNTTYGNMYLVDEEGNELCVYGTYSADGSTRYDAMETKPVNGDTVTVYGIIGSFTAPQMKNGWIKEHDIHVCSEFTEASCTAPKTCVKCGKTEGEKLDHVYVDGVCACGKEEPVSGEPAWKLVTDASTLKVGDQIVIVATDADYALSTNQKTNNRGAASVTKSDDTVTFGEDVQVLTLKAGATAGTWALDTGSGYLYAASTSKNYLKTGSTLNNQASFTITIADGVATIKADQSARNWLRYNLNTGNGDPLFSCYTSGQNDVSIYVLTTN